MWQSDSSNSNGSDCSNEAFRKSYFVKFGLRCDSDRHALGLLTPFWYMSMCRRFLAYLLGLLNMTWASVLCTLWQEIGPKTIAKQYLIPESEMDIGPSKSSEQKGIFKEFCVKFVTSAELILRDVVLFLVHVFLVRGYISYSGSVHVRTASIHNLARQALSNLNYQLGGPTSHHLIPKVPRCHVMWSFLIFSAFLQGLLEAEEDHIMW